MGNIPSTTLKTLLKADRYYQTSRAGRYCLSL